MSIKKFDYVRLIVILLTIFILLQVMPVHFFADNAEYLYLAKYYSHNFLKIFSPVPFPVENGGRIHHLFAYRPVDRMFFTICYMLSGLNPISYNILQGIFFLMLVISIYNITYLLSARKLAAILAVLFFLSTPSSYKLVFWLGSGTLLNSSLIAISLYFLLKSLKNNNYKELWVGLLLTTFALMSKTTAIFLIPPLFTAYFFLHNKQLSESKKLFLVAIIYILIEAIIVGLLAIIASKDQRIYCPANFLIYRMDAYFIIPNMYKYFRILCSNGYPYILIFTILVFLFKPSKGSFLALMWFLIYLILHAAFPITSSKYFAGAMVGLSIFLGLNITEHIKERPKGWAWLLISLLFIALLGSVGKMHDNIKKIQRNFVLVKTSYTNLQNNMARLSSLPKDATIYVDDDAPKIFYGSILLTMDRRDIKIKVSASKDEVDSSMFFYCDTSFNKTHTSIRDRLGDLRF